MAANRESRNGKGMAGGRDEQIIEMGKERDRTSRQRLVALHSIKIISKSRVEVCENKEEPKYGSETQSKLSVPSYVRLEKSRGVGWKGGFDYRAVVYPRLYVYCDVGDAVVTGTPVSVFQAISAASSRECSR